jgi:hypothetical protein
MVKLTKFRCARDTKKGQAQKKRAFGPAFKLQTKMFNSLYTGFPTGSLTKCKRSSPSPQFEENQSDDLIDNLKKGYRPSTVPG